MAATDHRLDAIRSFAAKALPGTVVVLDPLSKLVVDINIYQDGHAQERSLFDNVLSQVQPNDVWDGDRNFCTAKFLFTIRHLHNRNVLWLKSIKLAFLPQEYSGSIKLH